jgi:lipopolysaccharide/colanic/teichoic acid biosynthesis glycosyltransferase
MGRNGRLFTVRKFRSMVTDAEKCTGAVWAGRDDPRITRVGRILRKTAMDELPQVLNIWKGEMSIVGPRPERPELHAKFVQKTPDFEKRLQARPGMAGMAQVYGNYDSSPPEKLAYDLAYIRSMSLRLDMKLIALAVLNTVTARWGNATGGAEAAAKNDQPVMGMVIVLERADARAEADDEETRQAA